VKGILDLSLLPLPEKKGREKSIYSPSSGWKKLNSLSCKWSEDGEGGGTKGKGRKDAIFSWIVEEGPASCLKLLLRRD